MEDNRNQRHNMDESKEDMIPDDLYLKDEKPRREERKKDKGSKSYVLIALISAIVGGIVSSYLVPLLQSKNILPASPGKEYVGQNIEINTSDDINVVSAVAKKGMPSVVGITTVETQQLTIYDFILDEREVEGVGSGVIIDSDGYILTNSHVVADGNAKEIKVLFDNGEKVDGKVLWNDPSIDVAVVKVNKTNLPVAELGDSDALEIGELAVAIGNPLGLEFQRTVTSGGISGLNRSVRVDKSVIMDDLIQTDAAINPGNSGGPLLNKKGQVIAINTAKINSAEGLGFSIPINKIKPIIEDIIESGNYERVALRVAALDVLEYQARLGLDLGVKQGVIIIDVEENGPADQAGMKKGDIILAIDGKEVSGVEDMKKEFFKYRKNDSAKFTVLRDNKQIEINLKFTFAN